MLPRGVRHYDNNSNEALDQMSDAIAHSVITFAQSTALVNGVKGKGNFKSPAPALTAPAPASAAACTTRTQPA